MEYRKHLEEKFRRYQAILGDRASDNGEERIDLDSIAKDFCCIDDVGRINIQYIPLKGDEVYFTIYVKMYCEDKVNETKDFLVPISQVSDNSLQYLVEVMRKAMIIEELRNTYQS